MVHSLVIKFWKPGSPSWKANKSRQLKERKPPSWVKANRPARSKGERRKRPHGFGRRREEPTHRVEHATASCPDCQVPLIGGRVRGSRQVISTGTGNRACGVGAGPKVPEWTPDPDWSDGSAIRCRAK